MASCITDQWVNTAPQVKLTVNVKSQTATQAVLEYTLQYIASSPAQVSSRTYTIKIGSNTITGSYNANGVTGTKTIKTGTVTITKTKEAQSITFSISYPMNLTWSGVYKGTVTASGSISVSAKTSYTITYNANGGSGAPDKQTKWYGENLKLSATTPTRTGYSFVGWHYDDSLADAGNYYYTAGGTCGKNENLTLYAVWKPNTYKVTYNANGGSNAPAAQSKTHAVTLKLATSVPTRDRYNFLGWAKSASSTTVDYKAGANYTANQAVTLYAVWELAYVKPRITDITIERRELSDNDYVYSDTGTYAKLTFNYSCDEVYEHTSVVIKSQIDDTTIWSSPAYYGDGASRSGSFSEIIGDGLLDAERTYVVTIEVTDTVDSNTAFATLNGMNLPMDVLIDPEKGPVGMSFGKPAELEGAADFNYKIYPRKGFKSVYLAPGIDLNTIFDQNTYISEDKQASTYLNSPVASGTFKLDVSAGGDEGQVMQTLTYTSKTDSSIFRRFYYGNAWSNWTKIYSAAGKILWSGAWYMQEGQTATLSEKISAQPSGIQLVFSLYTDGTAYDQEFVVHTVSKCIVSEHSGKGYGFFLCTPFRAACKYLYISDTEIDGHENNNVETKTVNGITFENRRFVLRYVIGV
jgi:uncharacterized repeat protein (TIGR02543 family)